MRRTPLLIAALALLLSVGGRSAEPAGEFFFRPGDRVVFLGDSITEQYQYSTYIELYLTTRFPNWHLNFLNAGIGGDTATGGARRFAEHVLAEKPTALTIDFGMNDGGYGPLHTDAQANYVRNTEAMLEAAQKAGVRVALISPNAVDPRGRDHFKLYLETQKQFYAPLRELGEKYHVPFVDQYAVTRAVLEQVQADGASSVQPFPDGVHTSPAGGLLMAHTILTGLHAPGLVSDLHVQAATGDAKPKACRVEKLQATPERVAFVRTDEALPMPVQKGWLPILPYVDRLRDLNWYGLKVTGLRPGKYTLAIDGSRVGSFSAERLAEGLNLGNLTAGPIHEQGQKVLDAINAKNNLVHDRFRGVVMFHAPDWLGAGELVAQRKPAELQKRWQQITARQAGIYNLARPVSHQFELKPTN
jgi:lysophospholipase L1-like esterase